MIDWTKPVETDEEDPRPVRVLCTDRPMSFSVVVMLDTGLVCAGNHDSTAFIFLGGAGTVHLRNVRPKPVKREGWVNMYARDGHWPSVASAVFPDEETARTCIGGGSHIATVRIEWEEVPA